MSKDITKAASNILLGAEWEDSIEARVRTEIRGLIEEILEAELSTALGRARYARSGERLPGASESRARGNDYSSRTAGIWSPQRSSRSRADGNVWEDDNISSTRTRGDF